MAELAEDMLEYVKDIEEYEVVVLVDVSEEDVAEELLVLDVLVLLASIIFLASINPAPKTNPITFI